MKKNFIILFLLLCVFLTACSVGGGNVMMNTDTKISNKKFEEILECIETKDKETLFSLFSKKCQENLSDSKEIFEELFDYCNGNVKSYDDWGGPGVDTSSEYGEVVQIIDANYDVKTSSNEYRFTMRYISKDTSNPDNVGVHSLYVIKLKDDTDPQFAYWGDGKFTPGINIGIPNTTW